MYAGPAYDVTTKYVKSLVPGFSLTTVTVKKLPKSYLIDVVDISASMVTKIGGFIAEKNKANTDLVKEMKNLLSCHIQ